MKHAYSTPGVYFRFEPTRPAETLPRMDIAAFVGFAEAGPMHLPVPVESAARFREIFGADVPLAWDRDQARFEHSFLGPSVEAFFRNGGERTWIVRVGDQSTQGKTTRFEVPGLVRPDAVSPEVWVQARSPGSWADALRIATVLEGQRLTISEPIAASPTEEPFAVDPASPGYSYLINIPSEPLGFHPGDLLEVTLYSNSTGNAAEARYRVFVFVEGLVQRPRGVQISSQTAFWFVPAVTSPPASPPVAEGSEWLPMSEAEAATAYIGSWAAQSAKRPPSLRLLRFQMLAWENEVLTHRLRNLAFGPAHPRYWGHLPKDQDLFARGFRFERESASATELWDEVLNPRFPFAALEEDSAIGQLRLSLPWNMPAAPEYDASRPAVLGTGTRLERNGLGRFSADLFLDQHLFGISAFSLLSEAEYRRYVLEQPLDGIYSLLPVEEAALVAVPDAVHQPWESVLPPEAAVLGSPVLASIPEPDAFSRFEFQWSKVEAATRYQLVMGRSPDLNQATVLYEGTEETARLPLDLDCSEPRYFRVRGERFGEIGPWSNTQSAWLPARDFLDCGEPSLESWGLFLRQDTIHSSETKLTWLPETIHGESPWPAEDIRFDLQQSTMATFESFTPIKLDPGQTEFPGEGSLDFTDQTLYFRVRLRRGDRIGPWSNTVIVKAQSLSELSLADVKSYDPTDLLFVQRALLRFCSARGDLMALLSLPRHFRAEETLAHLKGLAPPDRSDDIGTEQSAGQWGVPPLLPDESRALSFGACYHPWIAATADSRQPNGSGLGIRYTPPDGAIAGTFAKGAIRLGAWVAPANLPLAGVLSRDPAFDLPAWTLLTEAQVNAIHEEARGFLVLNAETLGLEEEHRLINVRRLMILLRRLAQKEGEATVFEPNGQSLRDTLQHRFERILSDLYVRGAFAGNTPASAYRVVTDESVNFPESLDRGRLLIELRVAPSRPMAFLEIHLVQSGPGQFVVQEA